MLKWFNKKKKDNKGFTLVELIIVIAILAILVGLLAPQYTKYVEKSRKSADVSNLDNLVEGLKIAASDHEYNLGSNDEDDTVTVYTVAISDAGTSLLKDDSNVAATDDASKAIKEYTGISFESAVNKTLTTKSNKWGKEETPKNTGAKSEIYATITIDNKTDSVTVVYSDNVVEYSKSGKVTGNGKTTQ